MGRTPNQQQVRSVMAGLILNTPIPFWVTALIVIYAFCGGVSATSIFCYLGSGDNSRGFIKNTLWVLFFFAIGPVFVSIAAVLIFRGLVADRDHA